MRENNPTVLKQLLEVNTLGKWAVNCYQPNSDVFSFGVISPVSLNATIAELETLMSTNNSNCKIVKIQRLKRRNGVTYEDSASLKITFTGTVKVEGITIEKSYYRAQPYVSEPIQCFNCQRRAYKPQLQSKNKMPSVWRGTPERFLSCNI